MRFVLYSAFIIILLNISSIPATAQQRDKGQFITPKNEFWEEIEKSIKEFKKKETPPVKAFKMDFSGYDLPKSKEEFKYQWHNEPISQGSTGTCWCFAGTSFLESEIYRQTKQQIKISEMFTVYWQYVEKARRFVKEHGNSAFAEGSQQNAVVEMWKKYGCVPADAFTGMKPGQTFHDHSDLINDMSKYLAWVKENKFWNEDAVLSTIKSILDDYLGVPPTEITWESKKMSPLEFAKNVARINLDDYADFMSLMIEPYYTRAVYDVTDNWWRAKYNNIPLDVFMDIVKKSVAKGYTIAIGGDVSESAYDSHAKVGMVPTYDIPSEYIDENARQLRFSNNTTTDDHGIHIIGWKEHKGKSWFLIKDSGSGARNQGDKGYYYYHEDYIKLKMMNIMIHRSAVEDVLIMMK